MPIIEFQSNKEARKYINDCRKRMIKILEKIDPSFNAKFDNNENEKLFERANKILLHEPKLSEEQIDLIREIMMMEVNIAHINEVLKNNKKGFNRSTGIETLELDSKPIIPICTSFKKGRKVDMAILQAEDDAYRPLFEQNARRHAQGSKDAAGFGPCK